MIRKMLRNPWVRFAFLFPVIFIPIFMVNMKSRNDTKQVEREVKIEQERSDIANKVKQRQSDRVTSDNPSIVNQSQNNLTVPTGSNEKPNVETNDATETPQKANVNIVTEGPHKDMTKKELQTHLDLKQRKRALNARIAKHSENMIAIAEAQLQSSKDERALILSFFKNMKPDQLEDARKALLRTHPAEDVNTFFHDLANQPTAITNEQFVKEVDEILASDAALRIVRDELNIETEAIRQEYINLYGQSEFDSRMQKIRDEQANN